VWRNVAQLTPSKTGPHGEYQRRTLRYHDEIGLLKPMLPTAAARIYEERICCACSVMFFKGDVPLATVQTCSITQVRSVQALDSGGC
jgi:hypothetical protein